MRSFIITGEHTAMRLSKRIIMIKQHYSEAPYVPAVGVQQHFYLIISAQSHGKKLPYSMAVSGVRAYVPPSSPLPSKQGAVQIAPRCEGRFDGGYASACPSACRGCLMGVPQLMISSSRFCMGFKL